MIRELAPAVKIVRRTNRSPAGGDTAAMSTELLPTIENVLRHAGFPESWILQRFSQPGVFGFKAS